MVSNAPMFDNDNEDWMAAPVETKQNFGSTMMSSQDDPYNDFVNAGFNQPTVTIQTASGAAQNLDDDLTPEEREIVRAAAAK
jgi:hypothetical protein